MENNKVKDKVLIRERAMDHLVKEVPTARLDEPLKDIIEKLRTFEYTYSEFVYVLDEEGRLAGYIKGSKILRLPVDGKARDVMQNSIPYAYPEDDQEKVATLAVEHKKPSIPIVDKDKKLIGIIPSLAIIHILREEHIEDMDLLAGIMEKNKMAKSAIESNTLNRVKERIPYLLIGLLGSLGATLVMAGYEEVLEAHVALAFFVPGLVYLADAIGTQTFTVVIRGLSLNNISFPRLLGKELTTGLLIGTALGALVFIAIFIMFGNLNLAITVSLALVAAGTIATTVGLLLPWLLKLMKKDPALGSGPLATIIVDILSLVVYFVIAQTLVL